MGDHEQAKTVLLKSVSSKPYLWSAWKVLASLCTTKQSIRDLQLPKHWTQHLFLIEVNLLLHEAEDAFEHLRYLIDQENIPSVCTISKQSYL